MKAVFVSLGLCAGLFVLAACAPSPTSAPAQQASGGSLAGPVWGLTELMGRGLVPKTAISAEFTSDGKVSGSAGCNRYAGTYTTSGNNITMSSQLASTMMSCAQAINLQENVYLKTLAAVKTYAVTGDQLALKDANNNNLLVYKAQSQDLAGTSWEAIGYNNGKQAVTSVLAGTTITAEFGKDGILQGNSGCNTYNGPYKVNGKQITIGPLASTKKACSEPAGVMDQEAQYLAALGTAATYQIEGTVLELRTKDGALAVDYSKK